MKGLIRLECDGCNKRLPNPYLFDTADDPENIGNAVKTLLLRHRKECYYYGDTFWSKPSPKTVIEYLNKQE